MLNGLTIQSFMYSCMHLHTDDAKLQCCHSCKTLAPIGPLTTTNRQDRWNSSFLAQEPNNRDRVLTVNPCVLGWTPNSGRLDYTTTWLHWKNNPFLQVQTVCLWTILLRKSINRNSCMPAVAPFWTEFQVMTCPDPVFVIQETRVAWTQMSRDKPRAFEVVKWCDWCNLWCGKCRITHIKKVKVYWRFL